LSSTSQKHSGVGPGIFYGFLNIILVATLPFGLIFALVCIVIFIAAQVYHSLGNKTGHTPKKYSPLNPAVFYASMLGLLAGGTTYFALVSSSRQQPSAGLGDLG